MPIQEVIKACQRVAEKGKIPTIALVKTQLSSSLPLAVVIKGVKQYLANPSIAAVKQQTSIVNVQKEEHIINECKCATHIQQLQKQITQMSENITSLQAQVKALSQQ